LVTILDEGRGGLLPGSVDILRSWVGTIQAEQVERICLPAIVSMRDLDHELFPS
jgi:hypothetical protein